MSNIGNLTPNEDFERWWRKTGQFLPPADKLVSPEALEAFKQFAWSIWTSRKEIPSV